MKKKEVLAISCLLFSTVCCLSVESNVEKFMQDYFHWRIQENSIFSYYLGYVENATRALDYSFEAIERRYIQAKEFNARAKSFPSDRYMKMIQFETQSYINAYETKGYFLPPITFFHGLQMTIPTLFSSSDAFKWTTNEDYATNLELLRQVPEMIIQIKTLLEAGIIHGMTFAKESIEGTLEQLQNLQTKTPEMSRFFTQFSRNRVFRDEALLIIKHHLEPAFADLLDFMKSKYMKHVRKGPGVVSMPSLKGLDYYQACLDYSTTLKNTNATELYIFGLQELQKSQKRFKELAKILGISNDTDSIKDTFQKLNNRKEMYFSSSEEILKSYRDELENIKPRLSKIFEDEILTSRVFSVSVQPMSKNQKGLAFFRLPSSDGRRKGAFFVNGNDLNVMTKDIVATITLHEATPGHHMETSINAEAEDIPDFVNKFVALPGDIVPSMPGYTYMAFKEGWGLYSESLGHDLGIYKGQPLKEIGYVKGDLLRSARLVVDIGIHKYGWGRLEAIEFMVENTGYTRETLEVQVDRYISIPGQAVSYKAGEREIQRLRKKLTKSYMTLKEFHTHLLNCIGPLESLEDCIKESYDKRN